MFGGNVRFGGSLVYLNNTHALNSFPAVGDDGGVADLDLDFVAGKYWWNGALHTAAEFTTAAGSPTILSDGLRANTGDQLRLPDQSWFNIAQGTTVVEWSDFDKTNSGSRFAFSLFQGGGSSQQRFEIGTGWNGTISSRVPSIFAGTYSGATIISAQGGRTNGFYRLVITYTAGDRMAYTSDGFKSENITSNLWTVPMSTNGLGYRASGPDLYLNALSTGRLRRVTVFRRKQNDTWAIAQSLITTKSNLHILGDSFVAPGASLVTSLPDVINDTKRTLTFDGVASSTISEQADRFDATPQFWGRQCIIINGSADNFTASQLIAGYDRIAARCTLRAPIYVQPNMGNAPTLYTGQPARVIWDATEAAVLAHVGTANYVNTLTDMQTFGSDGSANDIADVSNGVWPRSCTGDGLHPNARGAPVEAASIFAKLTTNSW